MFTAIKKLCTDNETRCEIAKENLELTQATLDQLIAEENEQKNQNGQRNSCTKNILMANSTNLNGNDNAAKNCFKKRGVITNLSSEYGIIDNFMKFEANAIDDGLGSLALGYQVEYLAYRHENNETLKVIKILKVYEQYWGEQIEEQELQKQVKEVKNVAPVYFNIQKRSVLGIVKERKPDSLLIETEHKDIGINLDDISCDFVLRTGDRVYLMCEMQMDEEYLDKQGEILIVSRIEPTRTERGVQRRVERVMEKFIVLNEDAVVWNEEIPSSADLHLGDIVKVDLIECEHEEFAYRAIALQKLDKDFALMKSVENTKLSRNSENHAISILGSDRVIIIGTQKSENLILKVRSNVAADLKVVAIEMDTRRDSQLRLVQPDTPFKVPANGEVELHFEIFAKYFGECIEYYGVKFEKFNIKKSITVIVVESPEEAQAAERRLSMSLTIPTIGRNIGQRSRHYANQVWGRRIEVVPGECIATKRRFVATRIGYFEVPEALRQTYLTSDRRQDMVANIEAVYPVLKKPPDIKNYVQRFQLLVFLEEIEYFVNFRNYDRERAHFERDKEYLSLTIENLAERRPSLVIGDIVRAINPWPSENDDQRSFEGIVHKVLFNRILLKFNTSFQEKYNGQDFRLEFYFSRFGFRKQHHALHRIVKHLGEDFLFPKKVITREHPQCEVCLDENYNMYLYDTQLKWYNPKLNYVQKQAIANILRGETYKMPYVIFGPPGTGKTVTLVETILQLVRNLPESRLLVGTPSNSSADLITERIIDSQQLNPGDFVRLVSQNQIEKDLITEKLMPYCATVDIGSDGTCQDSMLITESGLKLRCQMKFLGRHRVTISTCTTLGNFMQMNFPPNHFTHVLIDEAGQCTEPESMVPINMVSKKHCQVILAGDPHQLQAIVINRYASDRGYSLSYLERILTCAPYKKDVLRFPQTSGYDPRLMTKLLYNYRALPSIMDVYSRLFYDNELKSMINEANSREATILANLKPIVFPQCRKTLLSHGTYFFGVKSENLQEDDSPSWFNPGEARSIFVITIKLYRSRLRADQIGIVTPYMKQVKHLRNMFAIADIAMPKIGSVEEFQGQERDVILVSTVRSSETHLDADSRYSLGFVRCAKRMNVAISRARLLLVIFGNPHLLAVDPCWRRLIRYTTDNGAYLGCDIPPIVLDNEATEPTEFEEKEEFLVE